MPVSNDKDLQAGTSKDSQELSARKQKLEDDIRHLEAVNKSLREAAAVRDIEAKQSTSPADEIVFALMCSSVELRRIRKRALLLGGEAEIVIHFQVDDICIVRKSSKRLIALARHLQQASIDTDMSRQSGQVR